MGRGTRLQHGVATVRRAGSAVAALVLVSVLGLLIAASLALAGSDSIRDGANDTKELKGKPELDIARVAVADETGRRVKFKITMHGKLTPANKNTRPFILINTRGGSKSAFENLVLGPRVFKVVGEEQYQKVGANKFLAKRKTWIYRFKPRSIGLGDGDSFGWAVLTAKNNAADLAPNGSYRDFEIDTIPPPA